MAENQKPVRSMDWGEINAELTALEGKTDPESRERSTELMDELLNLDMAYGQYRRNMIAASKKRREQGETPSSPEQKPTEG
jgi:hypothetical protein